MAEEETYEQGQATVKAGGEFVKHKAYKPYRATVREWEVNESNFTPGVQTLLLKYEIEGDPAGRLQFDWMDLPVTTDNKAGSRIQAILGRSLAAGEDVKFNDLLNRECLVMFQPQEKNPDKESVFRVLPIEQAANF